MANNKVLIGVLDHQVDETFRDENSFWYYNSIGGIADWMKPFDEAHVCKLCGAQLLLVAQLYCPLEGLNFHRCLYFFACGTKPCRVKKTSWKLVRAQLPLQNLTAQVNAKKFADSECLQSAQDWIEEADDWGSDSEEVSSETLGLVTSSVETQKKSNESTAIDCNGSLSKTLQNLDISSNGSDCTVVEKSRQDLENLSARTSFCSFFINVFEEPCAEVKMESVHEHRLIAEYERREGVCLAEMEEHTFEEGFGKEKYEKGTPLHGDEVFQKFVKRMKLCPEQCIRYCWNGSPLLIQSASKEDLDVPPCPYCNAQRVFECQLLPTLINSLKILGQPDAVLDFGVVLAYTCRIAVGMKSQEKHSGKSF